MMHRQHVASPSIGAPLVPAGREKVETAIEGAIYLPGDIDIVIYPGKYNSENPECFQMADETQPQFTAFMGPQRLAIGPARRGRDCGHAGFPPGLPRRRSSYSATRTGQPGRSRSSRHRATTSLPACRNQPRLRMPKPMATAAAEPRGRGRPRLGVVAREVTLLPRHWEWLGAQPGGASVALRKLVEEARRANGDADRARAARGCRLSLHVGDGRQSCRLRGSVARRCSPVTGGALSVSIAGWPTISATTSSSSPSAIAPIHRAAGDHAFHNITIVITLWTRRPPCATMRQNIRGELP